LVSATKTFFVAPQTTQASTTSTSTTRTSSTDTVSQLALATSPSPSPRASTGPYGTGSPYALTSPSPTSTSSGRVSYPSTRSGIPTSGSVGTTFALIVGGIFFIIAGLWSFWIANQLQEDKNLAA
jgi:cobalamin biosynthesis Mg chelatase CobN